MLLPQAREPLEVILKLAGETCNINCHYCYEKRKPYDNAQVLSARALRTFLRHLGPRPLKVGLHGGEPLLVGRPHMAALLAELRHHPAPVELSLQTNAVRLDEAWLAFFAQQWPSLSIGISLDGDEAANAHRVDYRGRSTHGRVVAALRRCAEAGREVGIISVVTRPLLGRAASTIDFFEQFPAVRALNLIPCLDYDVTSKHYRGVSGEAIRSLNPTNAGHPGWATTPDEYADFLIEAYSAWRDSGAWRHFTIEPFSSIIRVLVNKEPGICHFSKKKCAFILTLYPDGRVGSCDEFSMPTAQLGRLADGWTWQGEQHLGLTINPDLHARLERLLRICDGCDYLATCGGGCLASRMRYEGTPYEQAYCDYRMKIVDHLAAALPASQTGRTSAAPHG